MTTTGIEATRHDGSEWIATGLGQHPVSAQTSPLTVLVTAVASGEFPAAALGWALRAAGHEVLVVTGAAGAGAVAASALPHIAIGTAAEPGPATVHAAVADLAVAELVALARRYRPDLVVHEAGEVAGAVAAAAAGAVAVAQLSGAPVLSPRLRDSAPPPHHERVFTRFGLRPQRPVVWLDPCPPSLAVPAGFARSPVRFLPPAAPGATPGWLLDAPRLPRVCVAWEVTDGTGSRERLRQVLDGALTLDAEIVLATTDPGIVSGVRVLDPAAAGGLPVLLRGCDAVVHQGGTRITLTAAACGTPQLLLTAGAEPARTAERLCATGVGRAVDAARLPAGADGADLVGAEIAKLMDRPRYPAAARRLRAETEQQPSPADLVATLSSLPVMRPAGRSA